MGRVGMTEVASLAAAVCRIEMDNFYRGGEEGGVVGVGIEGGMASYSDISSSEELWA